MNGIKLIYKNKDKKNKIKNIQLILSLVFTNLFTAIIFIPSNNNQPPGFLPAPDGHTTMILPIVSYANFSSQEKIAVTIYYQKKLIVEKAYIYPIDKPFNSEDQLYLNQEKNIDYYRVDIPITRVGTIISMQKKIFHAYPYTKLMTQTKKGKQYEFIF